MSKCFLIILVCSTIISNSCLIDRKVDPYSSDRAKKYTSLKKALKHKNEVEILSLYGKGYTEFPKEILEFKNLTKLNLTHNQLKEIPPEIAQLKQLERLDLLHNQLTDLPPEISQLKALRMITLAYNPIDYEDIAELDKKMTDCLFVLYIEI